LFTLRYHVARFDKTGNLLLIMIRLWPRFLLCCALPAIGWAAPASVPDRYGEVVTAPTYTALNQAETAQHIGEYGAVSGRVHSVAIKREQTYINFGEDWKTDFTVYVPKATMKKMTPEALALLAHRNVRVRGYIYDYNGPCITLLNPDQLEILDAPTE
jgi:hypothetical protein